ncbi:MAG: glycosyl hydrolase 115 family protein [Bacteroidales bacterium]|nr:glycosyl hydrolase 115 family protein [Bacteroidales bacterium]
MKKLLLSFIIIIYVSAAYAKDNFGITAENMSDDSFCLIKNGKPTAIIVDDADNIGVRIAVGNLQNDFERVCGTKAEIVQSASNAIIVGSPESKYIKQLIKAKKIDRAKLDGKTEKYLMLTIDKPMAGVEKALVIAGSDRRGAIYGVYELSEQLGVSPWYDWADVPSEHHDNLYIRNGEYTAGEPAVRYRGIFLNDEAPCLTTWVKNTYGTDYGDHRFYARVFELLLRLRANFMWPAMWGWSFYADDELNSQTANDMGIIMGTSHHEPMARNHQEWVRKGGSEGVWDYASNQENIDKFFREGMVRARGNEDLITIGMRGDGDTPLGGREGHDDEYVSDDERNLALLRKIINNQRQIIKDVTGKPAEQRPQVWALYKEVQHFYDIGLRLPDDVIMLLSDDNWGDVRRVPNAEERKRKGGWGMYYHVDYVGAPRNSKWLNVTPIQNLWEQMQLCNEFGINKLWVLNVGDLKPMEYPITLFLNMAWNSNGINADNLLDHTRTFCAQQFGEANADEATRILNLCCKYSGRRTAEMLDARTYNLESGEWAQVVGEYKSLEVDALRQYMTLEPKYRDTYQQLILFPIQAMGNVYEMYYAQAMNNRLAAEGDIAANYWADLTEKCFRRDSVLCAEYNTNIAGGKWNGMMIQKHIGYFSWNDNFPKDRLPRIVRVEQKSNEINVFEGENGTLSIEAEHFFASKDAKNAKWTVIPYMGRTLSGVALMPYSAPTDGATLTYKVKLPTDVGSVKVHVVTKSTLPFLEPSGHCYSVGFEGGEANVVNFNANLNENPENIYSVYYPTVAGRVVDTETTLKLPQSADGLFSLTIKPLHAGIVFEKIVIDYGGYKPSYLFGNEAKRVKGN